MDNDQYKLSTFGLATVSAMKGIEEVHDNEPKRRLMGNLKERAAFAVLMIAVILLSSFTVIQYGQHIKAVNLSAVALNSKTNDC